MLGVLAICDHVEDFLLLLRSAFDPGLAVARRAVRIQPLQALAESLLVIDVFACKQVDKFGRAGFDGSARVAIGRDDGFAQRL